MMTGTVKWFNNTKGFGFIVPDDSGSSDNNSQRDIFAHYSEIDMEGYRALKAGQLVTFDIRNGEKGEQATNIKPISKVELPNYSNQQLSTNDECRHEAPEATKKDDSDSDTASLKHTHA